MTALPRYETIVISDTQENKTIICKSHTENHYLIVLHADAQCNLEFIVQAHSKNFINVLCVGQANNHIKSTILTRLSESHASANVHIVCLLADGSDVSVHGNITIDKSVSKVAGHLLEENIILGNRIKLRTAPILDVHSSDVQASHGCKVEQLDAKKLFYIQSRGLSLKQSQSLIIQGILSSITEGFPQDEKLLSFLNSLLLL